MGQSNEAFAHECGLNDGEAGFSYHDKAFNEELRGYYERGFHEGRRRLKIAMRTLRRQFDSDAAFLEWINSNQE